MIERSDLKSPEGLLPCRPEVSVSLDLEENTIPGGQGVIRVDLDEAAAHGRPGWAAARALEHGEVLEGSQGRQASRRKFELAAKETRLSGRARSVRREMYLSLSGRRHAGVSGEHASASSAAADDQSQTRPGAARSASARSRAIPIVRNIPRASPIYLLASSARFHPRSKRAYVR
jgi:hypothetical protein